MTVNGKVRLLGVNSTIGETWRCAGLGELPSPQMFFLPQNIFVATEWRIGK
jgi:hypothetical protein